MDPVSQGVLGAIVAQSFGKSRGESPAGDSPRSGNVPKTLGKAAAIGAIAAMTPDLDILISSANDPLLALEFHRQFTHSLLFIPVGAILCTLLLHPLLGARWQLPFRTTLFWCFLGYGTHGLLDACTTYGTQLLWPLSSQRFAWDSISVVDPLFTLPLLALTWLAIKKQSRRFSILGLAWVWLYLGFGLLQHERAEALGLQLAEQRGHHVNRLEAKPGFANLLIWKVVYETEDRFYVDAVKPGIKAPVIWPGTSTLKLDIDSQLPWLKKDSQQARDIGRFARLSADYLAIDPSDPQQIADIRYSMLPNTIAPMWGIRLDKDADSADHAAFYTQRGRGSEALQKTFNMILE